MNTSSISRRSMWSTLYWLQRVDITPRHLIFLEGLLAGFIAIGSLTWPLGLDQSFFYSVADTILRGGVPYRDAFELKGPLTYYICAFILAVFGHREISIRIFDLFVVALLCCLLKHMVLRVEGKPTLGAIFTIVFFWLSYICLGFWDTAQPDEWGGFLIAVAVALLLESSWSPRQTMTVIGVLIALAALIKPTFLIFSPLPLLYSPSDGRGTMSRLLPCGVYVFSCTATVTLSLALVFRHGGLDDYLDILHFLSSSYTPLLQRDLLTEMRSIPHWLWELGLAIPYALVFPALIFIRHTGYERRAQILLMWFALAVLMVLVQGRYLIYQFIPATIASAVILGSSLSLLTKSAFAPNARAFPTGFAALIIGLSVLAPVLSDNLFGCVQWPGYLLGTVDKSDYMLRIAGGYPEDPDRVAAYIDSHSNKSDTIFLWSANIRVLAIGKRRPATRFGTFEALITQGPLQAKYRGIFLKDLSAHPPRYIVVDCLDSGYRPESSLWLLKDFREFDQFLHRHYKLVTSIGAYEVWDTT